MSDNSEALVTAIERFNDQDSAYIDLYDEGIQLHGYPPGVEGRDGALAFYRELWAAFPDLKLSIDDQVEEGETIACRYSWTGTHQGAFMGVPATGQEVAAEGQTFMRFGGGQVVERWQALDLLGLLVQLGAVPPPGG